MGKQEEIKKSQISQKDLQEIIAKEVNLFVAENKKTIVERARKKLNEKFGR